MHFPGATQQRTVCIVQYESKVFMIRRQASLYLRDQFQIESIRLRYNPVQACLIPAHVTLCREDEVVDWDALRKRLESFRPFEMSFTFDTPVRQDSFVFLPVSAGLDSFHKFRRIILSEQARMQTPHVTLIHPRNGFCTDEIFVDILAAFPSPFQYTFREVMLIEQEDGGPWRVLSCIGGADT